MIESNDPLGQGIYSEYLGNIFLKKEEADKAIEYYQQAKESMSTAKQDERKIKQLEEHVEKNKKHHI